MGTIVVPPVVSQANAYVNDGTSWVAQSSDSSGRTNTSLHGDDSGTTRKVAVNAFGQLMAEVAKRTGSGWVVLAL